MSEDSKLFNETDLPTFAEPLLKEVHPIDFLKEVKEDVNLGC